MMIHNIRPVSARHGHSSDRLTIRAAIRNFRETNQTQAKRGKHSREIHISSCRCGLVDGGGQVAEGRNKEKTLSTVVEAERWSEKIYAKCKHLLNTSVIVVVVFICLTEVAISALQALASLKSYLLLFAVCSRDPSRLAVTIKSITGWSKRVQEALISRERCSTWHSRRSVIGLRIDR
jgi:type IV secretory pathway component VirB8